jgi:hypothetical protein
MHRRSTHLVPSTAAQSPHRPGQQGWTATAAAQRVCGEATPRSKPRRVNPANCGAARRAGYATHPSTATQATASNTPSPTAAAVSAERSQKPGRRDRLAFPPSAPPNEPNADQHRPHFPMRTAQFSSTPNRLEVLHLQRPLLGQHPRSRCAEPVFSMAFRAVARCAALRGELAATHLANFDHDQRSTHLPT